MSIRTPIALSATLAVALLSPAALAGKKDKKNKDAAPDAASMSVAAPTMNIPGDGDSAKFAAKLITTTISNFRPSDGDGAKFEYATLKFMPDNTWKASGFVEIMDERMECTESGGWTMEPADSASTATVAWTIASSDCPGREDASGVRAVMTLGKSGLESIKFR